MRASWTAGHFSGHAVCTLHMLLLALYSPVLCCRPGMKEIELHAAVQGGLRHAKHRNNDYVTAFHLAGHLATMHY